MILVAFNQAAALRRAIEAADKSKDRERIEILMVDCGSRDESPQLDSSYSMDMLRLPHHFGATKAMNIATRTAKAELVFFLSPDVEVMPDTITRLADKLEADPDTIAVCPLLVDEQGNPAPGVFRFPTKESFLSGLEPAQIDVSQESVTVEYPGRLALLVRKQFIRGINYFDEHFGEYWADADLAMRIRAGGKKIRLYPGIRAVRHPDTGTLTGDALAEADKTLGAAAFLSKYQGFFAGFSFRLAAILKALAHGEFRRFGMLASGQKLDGSQGM